MSTRPPNLVDTVHPRLLVNNYADCFRFYNAVLPELAASTLAEGGEAGPYARWNSDEQTPRLALLDRSIMAQMLQGDGETPADGLLLCFRLADVEAAQILCEKYGATVVSPAAERPEWGPDTIIAYLRDPAGNLVELQSSPD